MTPVTLRRDVAVVKRYFGHVVVRDSLGGAPVAWTSKPGRYVVAAWADERLVLYRLKRKGYLVIASTTGGLVVFRVRGAQIAVEQVLRFHPEFFPAGVFEPRADESGRRVAA